MYQSSGKVVYPNKNQGTLDLLANKEVDMVPAWADMALTQMKQGTLPESIRISQIDPSFTGSPVVLGIPSIGSNEDGAYAFIDYMLSADAQNIALDSMAAIPVIDYSLLDPELTKTIETLKVDSFRMSSLGTLGTELYEEWDKRDRNSSVGEVREYEKNNSSKDIAISSHFPVDHDHGNGDLLPDRSQSSSQLPAGGRRLGS